MDGGHLGVMAIQGLQAPGGYGGTYSSLGRKRGENKREEEREREGKRKDGDREI